MKDQCLITRDSFTGISNSHHGELLQGEFRLADRSYVRALVTLPSPVFWTKATFTPDHSGVVSGPNGFTKAVRAVEFTLLELGLHCIGGKLELASNIKIGAGCGSSAGDVTASILAVCDYAGIKLANIKVAEIAIKAELAYDPVVYGERAMLWAQRKGIVVEDFGDILPPLAIVGCSLGDGVDTLSFKMPNYLPVELEAFELMRISLRKAIQTNNLHLLGQVATWSAEVNQNYLPKPQFEELRNLVQSIGALGLQISHTGSIVGILLDPRDLTFAVKVKRATLGLKALGAQETWLFQTDNNSEVQYGHSI